MNLFIFKSTCFTLPFIIAYIAFLSLYPKPKGDLTRVGNLIDKTDYSVQFSEAFREQKHYSLLSQTEDQHTFDILTIGDSFSQQRQSGYQNYLAKDGTVSVLHYDQSCNPIQTLRNLLNSSFFDEITVEYVLIQSVERYFVYNNQVAGSAKTFSLEDFKNKPIPPPSPPKTPQFFSASTVQFPVFNFLYLFDDNAFFSKVYRVRTAEPQFSFGNRELLFHHEDLLMCKFNNDPKRVESLNKELNQLCQQLQSRGIKLIVMPSPDKMSAYHEYIENKSDYPKPLFFECIKSLEKDYIFIDTKSLVRALIEEGKKDVYYYQDTHWSPVATEAIADEIKSYLTQP